jgi:tRNA nucleotidyltransferase/poly(A) polymerase
MKVQRGIMSYPAKFPGLCGRCEKSFAEGADIARVRHVRANGRKWGHAACVWDEEIADARTAREELEEYERPGRLIIG